MSLKVSVFWIRADNFTNFVDDYTRILKILDPGSEDSHLAADRPKLLKRTLETLERSSLEWLLVLDNADDFDQFMGKAGEETDISKRIPRVGRILITTRDQRFQGAFAAARHGLQVRPMSGEEAEDLLIRSIPTHLVEASGEKATLPVKRLLEELGNLPLAIAQASANIRDQQFTLSEYVTAYRVKKQRMRLMKSTTEDYQTSNSGTGPQSVLVAWELSFDHLQQKYPLSATCLCYMGFFYYRNIPKSLITRLPEFNGLDPLAFQDMMKRLLHLSLVEKVGEEEGLTEYNIHPVVHERISSRLSRNTALRYLHPIIAIISALFPLVDENASSDRMLCQYLVPHAMKLTELGGELNILSRPLCRLLQVLSKFLSVSGMTEFAAALATKSLKMAVEVWDQNDPSILYVRKVKIECLNADFQYHESEAECGLALNMLRTNEIKTEFTEEILENEWIALLLQQVDCCQGLKKVEEVGQLFRELLLTKWVAEDPNKLATVKRNLSNNLLSQGKFDEAKEINDELLSWAESNEGKGVVKRSLYLSFLIQKGEILAILRSKSALVGEQLSEADSTADLESIIRPFREIMQSCGVSNATTWSTASVALTGLRIHGCYSAQAEIFHTVLTTSISEKVQIEGNLLHLFFRVWRHGLLFMLDTFETEWCLEGARIENLFLTAIEICGIRTERLFKDPEILNIFGVVCQRHGQFVVAERCHRLALETYSESTNNNFCDLIYYNIMLAIARQPGRASDAFAFREQHLTNIELSESTHGNLTDRLQRDKDDLALYNQAKIRLQAGQGVMGDVWWVEHQRGLRRGEVLYGPLSSVTSRSNSDNSTTRDQQQKGRKKRMFELPYKMLGIDPSRGQ